VIDAGEVPQLRDQRDGHRELHPAEGLQCLDDRVQAPRLHVLCECLCETLQACGVFGDRADVCLKDDWLGGCGTDHCREPPEVGRAPSGLARLANILPEEKGFAAELGGFALAQGLVASAAQVPEGFVRDLGDIDRGQVPCAQQAGPWDGVAAVGVDPIPGLLRDSGGGHDPADRPFFRQIAIELIPAGAGFRDEHQVCGLGLELADDVVNVGLSRAEGPKVGDLSAVIWSDRGHRNRLLMDIHSHGEGGRLGHG
jgi:hypothetical protein